jgi:hypothetical protein
MLEIVITKQKIKNRVEEKNNNNKKKGGDM